MRSLPLYFTVQVYLIPALYAQFQNLHSISTPLFVLLPIATLNHALHPNQPPLVKAIDRIGSHIFAIAIAIQHLQLKPSQQLSIFFWISLFYTTCAFHLLKKLRAVSPKLIHNMMHIVSAIGICCHIASI
jgi:hypothetical protein